MYTTKKTKNIGSHHHCTTSYSLTSSHRKEDWKLTQHRRLGRNIAPYLFLFSKTIYESIYCIYHGQWSTPLDQAKNHSTVHVQELDKNINTMLPCTDECWGKNRNAQLPKWLSSIFSACEGEWNQYTYVFSRLLFHTHPLNQIEIISIFMSSSTIVRWKQMHFKRITIFFLKIRNLV